METGAAGECVGECEADGYSSRDPALSLRAHKQIDESRAAGARRAPVPAGRHGLFLCALSDRPPIDHLDMREFVSIHVSHV